MELGKRERGQSCQPKRHIQMVSKVPARNLPRRRDSHADGKAKSEAEKELSEELHFGIQMTNDQVPMTNARA
jgi:hypothetical protein